MKKTALSWASLKLLSHGRWQWLPTVCSSLVLHLMAWSNRNLRRTEPVLIPIPLREVTRSYQIALVAWPVTVCLYRKYFKSV